jgi:CheY-like chemotaxis protein
MQSSLKPLVQVLLADDNPGDVILIREALKGHGFDFELIVQPDGEKMAGYLDRIDSGDAPCPDVVLLDLNLPKKDGFILLERIRKSVPCQDIPVIVVTSSDSAKDREATARLGANEYFRKPSDVDEFMRLGEVVRKHLDK